MEHKRREVPSGSTSKEPRGSWMGLEGIFAVAREAVANVFANVLDRARKAASAGVVAVTTLLSACVPLGPDGRPTTIYDVIGQAHEMGWTDVIRDACRSGAYKARDWRLARICEQVYRSIDEMVRRQEELKREAERRKEELRRKYEEQERKFAYRRERFTDETSRIIRDCADSPVECFPHWPEVALPDRPAAFLDGRFWHLRDEREIRGMIIYETAWEQASVYGCAELHLLKSSPLYKNLWVYRKGVDDWAAGPGRCTIFPSRRR